MVKKKKTHTVKGLRRAGLDPSSPPANHRLCWWLGVPAVAAAAGVGGVGMVWWCYAVVVYLVFQGLVSKTGKKPETGLD